jgi:hypothetical protein
MKDAEEVRQSDRRPTQAYQDGLQLFEIFCESVPVKNLPDDLIVNFGTMLCYLVEVDGICYHVAIGGADFGTKPPQSGSKSPDAASIRGGTVGQVVANSQEQNTCGHDQQGGSLHGAKMARAVAAAVDRTHEERYNLTTSIFTIVDMAGQHPWLSEVEFGPGTRKQLDAANIQITKEDTVTRVHFTRGSVTPGTADMNQKFTATHETQMFGAVFEKRPAPKETAAWNLVVVQIMERLFKGTLAFGTVHMIHDGSAPNKRLQVLGLLYSQQRTRGARESQRRLEALLKISDTPLDTTMAEKWGNEFTNCYFELAQCVFPDECKQMRDNAAFLRAFEELQKPAIDGDLINLFGGAGKSSADDRQKLRSFFMTDVVSLMAHHGFTFQRVGQWANTEEGKWKSVQCTWMALAYERFAKMLDAMKNHKLAQEIETLQSKLKTLERVQITAADEVGEGAQFKNVKAQAKLIVDDLKTKPGLMETLTNTMTTAEPYEMHGKMEDEVESAIDEMNIAMEPKEKVLTTNTVVHMLISMTATFLKEAADEELRIATAAAEKRKANRAAQAAQRKAEAEKEKQRAQKASTLRSGIHKTDNRLRKRLSGS